MQFAALLNPSSALSEDTLFSFPNSELATPIDGSPSPGPAPISTEATAMDVDEPEAALGISREVAVQSYLAVPNGIRQPSTSLIVPDEHQQGAGERDRSVSVSVVEDSDADEEPLATLSSQKGKARGKGNGVRGKGKGKGKGKARATIKEEEEVTTEADTEGDSEAQLDLMNDSSVASGTESKLPLPKPPKSRRPSQLNTKLKRSTPSAESPASHSAEASGSSTRDASPVVDLPFSFSSFLDNPTPSNSMDVGDAEGGGEEEVEEYIPLDYDGNPLYATEIDHQLIGRDWEVYRPLNLNWYEDDDTASFGVGRQKKRSGGSGPGGHKKKKGMGGGKEVEDEEEDEKDDRLYCLCRTLYDPEVRSRSVLDVDMRLGVNLSSTSSSLGSEDDDDDDGSVESVHVPLRMVHKQEGFEVLKGFSINSVANDHLNLDNTKATHNSSTNTLVTSSHPRIPSIPMMNFPSVPFPSTLLNNHNPHLIPTKPNSSSSSLMPGAGSLVERGSDMLPNKLTRPNIMTGKGKGKKSTSTPPILTLTPSSSCSLTSSPSTPRRFIPMPNLRTPTLDQTNFESNLPAVKQRMMIACDKCENWYHTDCIGIQDERVELVDQFICPVCAKTSEERTTWKIPCRRPTCLRPVAPLSKYCSDYCGIEVAATRLELSGLPVESFWSRVVGARKIESQRIDVKPPSSSSTTATTSDEPTESAKKVEQVRLKEVSDERVRKDLERRLSELVARRVVLEHNLSLVVMRSKFLEIAIKRWEKMCQMTMDAVAADLNASGGGGGGGSGGGAGGKKDGASGSKGSGKNQKKKGGGGAGGGATSSPSATCGFDVHLVLSSEEWEQFVESEEGRIVLGKDDEESDLEGGGAGAGDRLSMGMMVESQVCMRLRKKCDRHSGWQKVREADFSTERASMTRRLERLADQERGIRGQMEDHDEATAFHASHRHRLGGNAIDVEGKMTTPVKKVRMPTKVRAVGRAAGGSLVGGEAVTSSRVGATGDGDVGGGTKMEGENGYEVPQELLQFLSRREQAKLLRGGGRR